MSCTVDIFAGDGCIELNSCGNIALTVEQSKLLRAVLEAAERAVPVSISPNDKALPGGGFPTAHLGNGVQLHRSHVNRTRLAMCGELIRGSLVFTPEQVRELRRIIKPFEAQV